MNYRQELGRNLAGKVPVLQVQRMEPNGATPGVKGVAPAAATAATGWLVQLPALPGTAGVHPAGAPGIAGIAGDSAVGTIMIVFAPAAEIAGVYETVMTPSAPLTVMPDTLAVATGGAQPLAKAAALAAFSATASFAPS